VSVDLGSVPVTAIVGPNGAGKTTLLNVITGFVMPVQGRILFNGEDLVGLAPWKVSRLGAVRTFQEVRVVKGLSALDNVLLGRPRPEGESLAGALRGLGAATEANDRDNALALLEAAGLGSVSGRIGGELSYGQQKLLALCSCLAAEPKIVLLDEPVAGVSPRLIPAIVEVLSGIYRERGIAVVLVEHDLAVVRDVSDAAVVMDAGRVVAKGRPENVLELAEVVEAFVG